MGESRRREWAERVQAFSERWHLTAAMIGVVIAVGGAVGLWARCSSPFVPSDTAAQSTTTGPDDVSSPAPTAAAVHVSPSAAVVPTPAPKDSHLEVVDLRVNEDTQVRVEASDPSVTIDGSHETGVEVLLRNRGDVVSVVNRAEFVVRKAVSLGECSASGSSIRISWFYDVALPREPAPGTLVPVPLSQQVPPRGADRFAFSVGLADAPLKKFGRSEIHHLSLRLYHDGKPAPLDAGDVVIASSFPGLESPSDYYSGTGACATRNKELIAEMLAFPAARSPELDALGRQLDAL